MKTYIRIYDPGHSWLEVPKSEVKELGIRPSGYSPIKKGNYYLEEDCDLYLFIEAMEKKGKIMNVDYLIKEVNVPAFDR